MKPKRIQRKRTKGFRLPPNTINCTRPGPLGNPLAGRDAVWSFFLWLRFFPDWIAADVAKAARDNGSEVHVVGDPTVTGRAFLARLPDLREAEHLACWCPLDQACHVDVYLELLQ